MQGLLTMMLELEIALCLSWLTCLWERESLVILIPFYALGFLHSLKRTRIFALSRHRHFYFWLTFSPWSSFFIPSQERSDYSLFVKSSAIFLFCGILSYSKIPRLGTNVLLNQWGSHLLKNVFFYEKARAGEETSLDREWASEIKAREDGLGHLILWKR